MKTTNALKQVILAEDDIDDVLIFKLALEKVPIVVELTHASDGDELLTLLKELIPDIIFLDIKMPCRDGVACIVEIRKNQDFDNVPVIMYTSFKDIKHINDSYSNGANFYVIKANTIMELAEKLKRIFSIDWKSYMYYPPKSEFVIG